MPRSCIKILNTVVFGIPRSASSSCTVSHQSLLTTAHTHWTFWGILLIAGLPEHGSLSADSWPSLYLCHTLFVLHHYIIPESLLNNPNSLHEGMFKLNAKSDADSLLYSVILNVMATQYTCSFNSVYRPYWLIQCSHHCSCMQIPVYSPWLPGYINVMQTILFISTMAGLFLGRPV